MFLTRSNTLGTPAIPPKLKFDLIFCPQRAHTPFVAIYLFIIGYVRRGDENAGGTNDGFLSILPWTRNDDDAF